ncbi:peroxisomal acyl-coenzyme A oxidase 1-like [Palaemon carinicauda]|uniref:peroxisomal acyl-coenzyme A oxidase 1-like n=1 Tax=Palaemon carinicauda TaxID=392227 RepID=UPI0035B5786F
MSTSERFCVSDLKEERAKCDFDLEELTNLMDGGKEMTELRRQCAQKFLNDPAFTDEIPQDYLSHEDRYGNELRKACHTVRKMHKEGITIRQMASHGPRGLTLDGNPLMLHLGMFYDAIGGHGNKEQREKWLPLAENADIIGTYAQTEMGHGTFLRGLETTATYDKSTQEFIIHSPTLTATKWWPGGLGKTANFTVLMAQLYIDGKCLGPHPFLVQIRDLETHQSLPGIIVGEIGPRAGLNGNDNGFLRFEHHRIPRTNMLMKHSQVLEDGTYVKPPHAKLSYGTMVITRVSLVYHAAFQLRQAVTIATRYSAVRRQSELVPGEPEPQILDYQTQQHKIIPQIASVFALLLAAQNCGKTYVSAMSNIQEGDMELLPELHALSSGLKAIGGKDASEGVEICRLACGGHGYIASSNLPRIYGNTTCIITYEGENTVLLLQVARYLIKSFRAGRTGTPLQKSVAYLSPKSTAGEVNLKNAGLVEAFKRSVSAMVAETEGRLRRLCDSGLNYHHAWNRCSVSLVKCAEAHNRYYICDQFVKNVESLKTSLGVRNILKDLCRLYLIYHITLEEGMFLKAGVLSPGDIKVLEEEMTELLGRLRHQAVNIVDSFDIDDKLLHSTIGAWDGNVYQRLYDEAMKSPLNKTDVPKAYHKYLKPLINAKL